MRAELNRRLDAVWSKCAKTHVTGVTGVTTAAGGVTFKPGYGSIDVTDVSVTYQKAPGYAGYVGYAPNAEITEKGNECRRSGSILDEEGLAEPSNCKTDVVDELQRWAYQEPCCPNDIVERGAGLTVSAGLPPDEADAQALAEHGFASWAMLAQAHRTHILAKLHGLPPSDGARLERLVTTTRTFLDTGHWQRAIQLGWTMTELFGVLPVAPVVRVDGHGLVPSIALSKLVRSEIVSIEDHGAVMQFQSGSRLTYYRCEPAIDYAVPWWACTAIIDQPNGKVVRKSNCASREEVGDAQRAKEHM